MGSLALLSIFEFTLPRPSYTYHTLQALRKAYPDHEFSLIIGEDNWQCFDRWYRGEDIARETPIIVYPRDAEGELRIKGKDSEWNIFCKSRRFCKQIIRKI